VIKRGEAWGSPTASSPDAVVTGGDAALAAAASATPGALFRFEPDATSDLARAVGVLPGGSRVETRYAVALDALRLADGSLACNMCVVGLAPDRLRWSSNASALDVVVDGRPWYSGPATTVVIATGQYLRGLDLVPRGHPGDHRAEIHVYALRRSERHAMRSRLPAGSHVPHPRIKTGSGRHVAVTAARPLPVEVDGAPRERASEVVVEVVADAYRLLL